MKSLCLLFLAAPLLAQITTLPGGSVPNPLPTPYVVQQTYTTGMVGFTTNQTARLNVFNLNPVETTTSPTTAPPPNCTAELRFFDQKGAQVSQSVVPNFAPGASTSLDLTRIAVTSETSARAEIRAAVTINPAPTPVGSPAAVGNCSVVSTLEIFDTTSGSTVALTSDFRSAGLQGFASFLNGMLK